MAVKLYVGATDCYSGNAVVKSAKITAPATDIMGVSYDLEFTGTISSPTEPLS